MCAVVTASLDAFAHGDVVAQPVEFFAVGGALGFFGGEGGRFFAGLCAEAALQVFDARGKRDEGVGERVFDVVRIGEENAFAGAINDVGGNADDGGVGGHVVEDDRAGADAGVFADGDVAEDVGVVADEDAVADGGVTLTVAFTGTAESDALIEGDVAADDGGFADDDAGGVVDEEAAAEQGSGVDVDAGEEAAELGEDAGGKAQFGAPEGVADAVSPDGPEAGVTEEDFEAGARSRIALQDGADVFAYALEEFHEISSRFSVRSS